MLHQWIQHNLSKINIKKSNIYPKTHSFIETVGNEYKKVVGYEGGFFGCSSGDGVNEI